MASRLAREEKDARRHHQVRSAGGHERGAPAAADGAREVGFPVPVRLAGEWFGYADHLLRTAQTQRWIDREAALTLLSRYRAGDPDVERRQLWVLIVFSLGSHIYVERLYDPVRLGWEPAPR